MVSTRDQHRIHQQDALRAAGCEKPASLELDNALLVARGGDQLVVTKLDRLGDSLE